MKYFVTPSIIVSLLLLLSCTGGGEEGDAVSEEAAGSRPNVLWISCEDISPRLGCYGDPVARTPNIDRLAREGARYTNVYTSAPVCAPVRSGIITGMYQTAIGTHHMRTSHTGRTGELPTPYCAVPPHYVKAFTEYMRAEGYYCTNNAKTDYQFATFSDVPMTIWDESSHEAHYRNRKDQTQPFFAVFNYTLTHESRTWQQPSATDPSTVPLPPYYPDTPPVRRSIARLYDQIARLDSIVGERLRELEADGLEDNTVVFFWSDHGDGLPRGKRWPYDSGTKIPLILRWPGVIEPGTVDDRMISSIDFGPTVLSMASIKKPYHVQGRAFAGMYEEDPRQYAFSARDRFDESYDMIRSVRDDRFRYIRNYYVNTPYVVWVPYRNQSPIMKELLRLHAEDKLNAVQKLWFRTRRPPEELYDCTADPHQVHNIADDPGYTKQLRRLRTALDAWRIATRDLGDISEYAMVEGMWPGGEQPATTPPHFVPNAPENRNAAIADEGGVYEGPVTISLYCATQGASMAYTMEEGANPHWTLYTGPIKIEKGTTTLRAVAIRYGFSHSDEVRARFEVH